MIIELIIGYLLGRFVAKNKKTGFIIGAICGAVWGFISAYLIMSMEDDINNYDNRTFLMIIIIAEAAIVGLMAMVVAHNKMRKQAKKAMQDLPKEFE